MSEQNTAVETTAVQPENTPVQAVNTQPTVDVEKITQSAAQKATEAAEKKMEAVFKSMLQQQGLDTETINKMTAEWKSQQRTPEDDLKEARDELSKAQKQLDLERKQNAALGKGIPADRLTQYMKLAESYVADDVDFAAGLDKALEDFPIKKDVPELVVPAQTSTGSTPAPIDPIESKIRKRMGLPPEPRS